MERRKKAPQSPGPEGPGGIKSWGSWFSHTKIILGLLQYFNLVGETLGLHFLWLDYQPLFGAH